MNTSLTDGSVNWQIICDNVDDEDTEDNYRAFEYCDTLGEGWYIPSRDELMTLYFNKATVNATIKILKDNSISAVELPPDGVDKYWLYSSSQMPSIYNYVYTINFINGWCSKNFKSSNIPFVRALRKF